MAGAAVAGFFGIDGLVGIIGKPASGGFSKTVALIVVAIAVVFATVGFIRFIKWAWKD